MCVMTGESGGHERLYLFVKVMEVMIETSQASQVLFSVLPVQLCKASLGHTGVCYYKDQSHTQKLVSPHRVVTTSCTIKSISS